MKEGNTTAMLEQLRLREVALNSIFAKTGQKIRVKAVKVHKNNNERVGLEVRDKELPIVLTYYPTADDMMQPDVRLIERIVELYSWNCRFMRHRRFRNRAYRICSQDCAEKEDEQIERAR